MHKPAVNRPSPALIVAMIALVAALAGTASALPGSNQVDKDDLRTGSVGGRAIQPGAVNNHKLKDGAVTDVKISDGSVITPKIADQAVTGDKIAEDPVAGRDVDESTLGEVPSAKHLSYQKQINVRLSFGEDVELVSNGPISVRARCVQNGTLSGAPNRDGLELYARTAVAGSFLNGFGNNRLGDTNLDGALQDNETLDPVDPAETSVLARSPLPSTAATYTSLVSHVVDAGYVLAPDGQYIGTEDGNMLLGLKVLGADCAAIGTFEVQG